MRRAAGMIVCDLDGTLLTSDGSVTARTVAAVAAVRQAGWLFVIATGRPVRDTRPVVEHLEHRRPAICGSGAVVYDFEAEMILEQSLITPAAVRDLLEGLRSVHPAVTFGVEQGLDFILEPGFVLERQLFAPGTVCPG
jgi:HAD superfamily hydrolase (TIGR01484 family)